MNDLQQIRENLAKIRELDLQMEQMQKDEETQKFNQANQIVDVKNIELQLLLEEMEQQQEISRKLQEENQELQRKLQSQKLRYEKAKDEIDNYNQTQKTLIEKQRKAMEAQQTQEDINSQKEEKRLNQSMALLVEKNEKLQNERKILQGKVEHLKASLMNQPAKKKTTKKTAK